MLALAGAVPSSAAECPSDGRSGFVTGVAGGGDLTLDDGRTLRLAGLAADFGDADHDYALRTALTELAVGRTVEIASAGAPEDRYGRLVGMVRAPDGTLLQKELVELGLALVRPEAGYMPCLPRLMQAEASARTANRGLWAMFPVAARDAEAVRAMTGRFVVIEGRVHAVGAGREVDYLNFDRVWRHDVTVRVPVRARAAFAQAGMPLDDVAGRMIRARGVVFEAGGPAIEARWPEQIELEGTADQ